MESAVYLLAGVRTHRFLRLNREGNDYMKRSSRKPVVGIIMGSQSDWKTMEQGARILDGLGIRYETKIVSAHRTPDRLYDYAKSARDRGLMVIIAGAGGAAHLPGMTASMTTLPVLGVPIESRTLKGLDSLLSIAQMPAGIPVGTLAIGSAGARNAALLAASIVSLSDDKTARSLEKFRKKQTAEIKINPSKDKSKEVLKKVTKLK